MTVGVALQVLAVVVPTVAVVLAWRSTHRQAVADARASLESQRLGSLADELARAGRDLRDALAPPEDAAAAAEGCRPGS